MSALIDGLQPLEILMAALGTLLFIVLLPLFVRQVWANRPYNSLLAFFMLPVVMVGWPSIQKIKFDKDSIELEKATAALKANPRDTALRTQVETQVKQLETRPASSPRVLADIGEAWLELGQQAASEAAVDKGLQTNPDATGLKDLKGRIETYKRVKELTSAVERNPTDTATKVQLQDVAKRAAAIPTADPQVVNDLATAQLVTGNAVDAAKLNNRALEIAPSSPGAIQLRERILRAPASSKQ